MARYQLEWRRSTKRDLKGVPPKTVGRIVAAAEALCDNPRPDGTKKLKGSDCSYRLRVGNFRIVYEVFDDRLIVEVIRIGDRKDIYRS